VTRVAAKVDASTIRIERPMPWTMFPNHGVKTIHRWSPRLNNIGIEGLSFEFNDTGMYPGHFNELGFNALSIRNVANSWIRDIQTRNADFGIEVDNSFFITILGFKSIASGTGNWE
jgi:hypothetical protein